MNLEIIQEFAKNVLVNDLTGHDWRHALRVEKNAKEISPDNLSKEEIEIVRASCWLHDTIDAKIADDQRVSIEEVKQALEQSGATPYQVHEILYIIQNLSYSKNIDQKKKLSLAGQIVQDADRLDAIGAIGTARAFYYGGSKQHLMYDDTRPRKPEDITSENYRDQDSVVNHFFEKLLILKDTMNTEKGKWEAQARTKFMEDFLAQLFREIKGT